MGFPDTYAICEKLCAAADRKVASACIADDR